MTDNPNKKPIIYRKWFKILLACAMLLPLITVTGYAPQDTFNIIAEVLKSPFSTHIKWLLPIMKLILLAVALCPFYIRKYSEKVIFSYYLVLLILVGVFQNLSATEYGLTFITGNAAAQFTVAGFCIYDLVKCKSKINKQSMDKSKLWLIPLMLFAFLMPYTMLDSTFTPGFQTIFTNEAGITYCMITPIITGVLILFHKSIHKPTLNVISFVGLIFGISSMATWFIFDNQNWWLGILRLPLLIISVYGILLSKYKQPKKSTLPLL